jgi:selenide, water dikinase
MNKRLTSYSTCGGCASKLAAGSLARVLGGLAIPDDDRVLVDHRTADDAGVFRLDDERALVQTVDFFTPIVDDPFVYGQIAAANALSDVYAMGGRPLTALAVAAMPKELDPEIVGRIFAGGLDQLQRANVALLGGHTVQDQEIKFGYAVTGEVHPERVWANAGARVDDVLIFTKALGTGVISTALRAGVATMDVLEPAMRSMLTLNRAASEALRGLPHGTIHACTDVTGFGFIGHASEMACASGVTLEIDVHAVPLLPGVLDLVETHTPGGGRTNAEHFGGNLTAPDGLDPKRVAMLNDPQTSGGLLIAVGPDALAQVRRALTEAGAGAAVVGRARVPRADGRRIELTAS